MREAEECGLAHGYLVNDVSDLLSMIFSPPSATLLSPRPRPLFILLTLSSSAALPLLFLDSLLFCYCLLNFVSVVQGSSRS